MYRFLIAERSNMVRVGIRSILTENFSGSVIDEASDVSTLLGLLAQNAYNLVIFEIDMPGGNYIDTLHRISTEMPESRVLVFTSYPENAYGPICIRAGAQGFLTKSALPQEIVRAIQRILDGRKYISEGLYELLIEKKAVKEQTNNPFELLSARELEICMLLQRGISLREICNKLKIQYSTANTYKRRIFEKLQIGNFVSLVKLMGLYRVGK